MDREIVERTILHDLYEAWFVRDRSNDMDMIRERNGWEDPSFWRIVDHMADAGHVRAVAIGGWYEITPNGIVLAENEGIAPEELTKTNQRARTLMLDSLATVYEQEGAWVHTYYQMLCEKTSLDAPTVVNNLQVFKNSVTWMTRAALEKRSPGTDLRLLKAIGDVRPLLRSLSESQR